MAHCRLLLHAPRAQQQLLRARLPALGSALLVARPLSAPPESLWRAAVAEKFASLDARMQSSDERLASLEDAMEANKEAIEKSIMDAMGRINSDVDQPIGCIKADINQAMRCIKADVNCIKADGGINADVMKDSLQQESVTMTMSGLSTVKDTINYEFSTVKDTIKSEFSTVKDTLKSELSTVTGLVKNFERKLILAVAVYIFGEPVLGGIRGLFHAAKEGASRDKA